jgi:hypothetical protein
MIATKCPACGAEGRVPNTKVNTRLVCPKCLKIFHVTSAGRSVIGEPPTPGAVATPKAPVSQPADQAQKVERVFEGLSLSLSFSPRSLVIAACVLGVGLLAAFLSFRKGETLDDRVEKVTRAVVEGDLQTLRGLASTGTTDDAVLWYGAIRPQCDAIRQHLGSHRLVVAVMVTQRDNSEGTANVIATTFLGEESMERKPGTLPEASVSVPSTSSISIPMCFRSEGWSGWRLDGKRTSVMPSMTR